MHAHRPAFTYLSSKKDPGRVKCTKFNPFFYFGYTNGRIAANFILISGSNDSNATKSPKKQTQKLLATVGRGGWGRDSVLLYNF